MRRADLEHVIRAAASMASDDELVIVGSQAILGQPERTSGAVCVERGRRLPPAPQAKLVRVPELLARVPDLRLVAVVRERLEARLRALAPAAL